MGFAFWQGRGVGAAAVFEGTARAWRPAGFGPGFLRLEGERILLTDGPLAMSCFGLEVELGSTTGRLRLTDGRVAGHALVERDPDDGDVVLWDVGVRADLRQAGLASVMVSCLFRELLAVQRRASFRIRMVTASAPGNSGAALDNVGMCVIANRLGFTPDTPLAATLRPGNLVGVELVPPRDGNPPAFRFTLRSWPLVATVLILDPKTRRPETDPQAYTALVRRHGDILEAARDGRLVPGEGDHALRASGARRFVNCLAADAPEAAAYHATIRPA